MGKKVLAVGIIRKQRVLFPYSDPMRSFTTYHNIERSVDRFDGIVDRYGMLPLAAEIITRDNLIPISQTKGIGQ